MAQGRHSFLWPKATRFNESQVPPMAGKSGQIKFPLINSSTGAQGGPVCKICPLILTLDPYWGPQGGLK